MAATDLGRGNTIRSAGRSGLGEMKLHRSQRGGSIGLVLLIAVLLVGAAVGLLQVGRGNTVALYPDPAGHPRHRRACSRCSRWRPAFCALPGKENDESAIKGLVDGAFDGILVTDAGGRVLYANAAYLQPDRCRRCPKDVRPIERVFIGDPDVSEAVYRLLKAAREGRRLQEEVRVGGLHRRTGALAAHAGAAGRRGRKARTTVWSVADVTRDREKQENVFQELQHAIDYLDHAPAGFFSADAQRQHRLSERHAGKLARPGSRGGRLRRAETVGHRVGRGRPRSLSIPPVAGRREDRSARSRFQDPQRPLDPGATVPQGGVRRRRRARALAHARAQSRARRGRGSRSAPPKCASCASSTTRRWRSRPSTGRAASCARTRCSRACSRALARRRAQHPVDGRRARARRARTGHRQGERRAGRHRSRWKRRWRRAASASRPSSSPRSTRTASAIPNPRSSMRSTPPSGARWKTRSSSSRRWTPSASSPAASRTTSTTCCRPS